MVICIYNHSHYINLTHEITQYSPNRARGAPQKISVKCMTNIRRFSLDMFATPKSAIKKSISSTIYAFASCVTCSSQWQWACVLYAHILRTIRTYTKRTQRMIKYIKRKTTKTRSLPPILDIYIYVVLGARARRWMRTVRINQAHFAWPGSTIYSLLCSAMALRSFSRPRRKVAAPEERNAP